MNVRRTSITAVVSKILPKVCTVVRNFPIKHKNHSLLDIFLYRYAPHKEVWVNDGRHL
jgi:hypothetical protein